MRFQVALSFAGEQRDEARQIAQQLKNVGLRVFFDEDFEAEMWGRDLNDYLTNIYLKESEYVLMLISEAYARKIWTNQERRSALANALLGKQDYILPVRFDDTELSGMLPTTHYLEYARKGVQGVCAAVMQKLGKSPAGIQSLPTQPVPAQAPTKAKRSLSKSSYVMSVAKELDAIFFIPVIKDKWGTQKVELTVQPDDPNDGPMLNKFGKMSAKVFVAYDHFFGDYKITDTTRISGGETNSGKSCSNRAATKITEVTLNLQHWTAPMYLSIGYFSTRIPLTRINAICRQYSVKPQTAHSVAAGSKNLLSLHSFSSLEPTRKGFWE
jgi:hypothetical protein